MPAFNFPFTAIGASISSLLSQEDICSWFSQEDISVPFWLHSITFCYTER